MMSAAQAREQVNNLISFELAGYRKEIEKSINNAINGKHTSCKVYISPKEQSRTMLEAELKDLGYKYTFYTNNGGNNENNDYYYITW